MKQTNHMDIIAFGPHPDDVEMFCGGTIAKLVQSGYSVALIDMTNGELGTRGTAEDRFHEAQNAAELLGITQRIRLGLPDGGLNSRDYSQRHQIVETIRGYSPDLILAPAARDRHPDHIQGSALVEEAIFLANVGGYPSDLPRHKVSAFMRYPMWWQAEADLVIDVSETWKLRMDAVQAYKTQFHTPGVDGPATLLADEKFVEWLEGRGSHYGKQIGVRKGEPFLMRNPIPVDNPFELLVNGAGHANP